MIRLFKSLHSIFDRGAIPTNLVEKLFFVKTLLYIEQNFLSTFHTKFQTFYIFTGWFVFHTDKRSSEDVLLAALLHSTQSKESFEPSSYM